MPSDQDSFLEVPAEARPRPGRLNALVFSLLCFCLIGFGVWLVSAGKRYREEYAQSTQPWHVGATVPVEITVVPQDKQNLSCAADQVVAGLQCGFAANARAVGPASADDPRLLQPFNTIGNELLLGAGLWTWPDLKRPLPAARFTVVCDYHVEGLMRSAAIRFSPAAAFGPTGKIVTAGRLTDCVLPR